MGLQDLREDLVEEGGAGGFVVEGGLGDAEAEGFNIGIGDGGEEADGGVLAGFEGMAELLGLIGHPVETLMGGFAKDAEEVGMVFPVEGLCIIPCLPG